ncbi:MULTISPECIES: cell division protein ZapA [Eubacteriales]|uniref:cell division protein ZapA n=1 Tax=Eubacteriales TaxID=186802 RepID=UPI000B37B6F7|nr:MULTISPECIES: cell division protein ZapA [Eubacteriales]MDY4166907.1 cell division protein ZapA [Fournierella sp.]OUP23936.1 cell division protein ZapA [Gemmiger sp. An194]
MPVTKVKLTICGSNYIVSTTDSEEYVNQLAERLDTDMTEIMTQNPSASVAASAVISALSYLDELNKNASSTDNMRAQIKDYLEDAAKAKLEAENARRQVEKLTAELNALKAQQAAAAQAAAEQAALLEKAEEAAAGEETAVSEESNEQ